MFLGTFAGGGLLLYGLLLLIDPYDSGRFPNLGLVGVSDSNLRTADVSRGRDRRYDSALFGSSTGQSIDPQRLSAGTGLRFVQLSITGSGPREILSMLGWFLRWHGDAGAVVVTTDVEWCAAGDLKPLYPFPYWLYGGDVDYLANVLDWKSLDRAAWRIQLAMGRRRANDPVGFFPYEAPTGIAYEALPPHPPDLGRPDAPFPWVERLGAVARVMPPHAGLVIVMPPVTQDYLPAPGSAGAARVAACKAALAGLAQGRGGLVDDRVDGPLARDTGNFYDRVHYRVPVARGIETQVIAALSGRLDGPAPGAGVARRSAAEDPHDTGRR